MDDAFFDSQSEFEKLCEQSFLNQVLIQEEIDSTNNYAITRLAEGGTAEGTEPTLKIPSLILAKKQTAGRGRGANQWWSAGGSLTFSIIIDAAKFQILTQNLPLISLGTAVALANTVEHFLPPALPSQLKWPNDLYVDNKKMAGILVEIPNAQQPFVVIGIGVNINNSLKSGQDDLSNEIQSTGTSLYDLTGGETTNRMEFLQRLIYHLENVLNQLGNSTEGVIAEEVVSSWRSRCWLSHRSVSIQNGEQVTSGTCRGIDDDGALLLYTESGLQKFHGGTIVSVESL